MKGKKKNMGDEPQRVTEERRERMRQKKSLKR
jgi:hypothetical protein